MLVPLVAAAGCGEAHDPGPQAGVEIRRSAIAGGNFDTTTNAVVGIVRLNNFGLGICSGTLISPNVVLTARHCVSQPTQEAIVCDPITDPQTGQTYDRTRFASDGTPAEFYISNQPQLTNNGSDYVQARRLVFLPGEDSVYTCGHDVAMIVLAEPITTVAPIEPRIDSALAVGETYSAVGYGNTSERGGGSGARRRRDGLVVQYVGELNQSNFTIQEESEWTGNTGVCQGDSGGPALDAQGKVVGVVSRGGRDCSTPIYGRVDYHGEWIKTTVQQAAKEAGITPPAWAAPPTLVLGDDCTVGTECISGTCINDGTRQYCSEPCGGGCAAGYYCETSLDLCVEDRTPVPPTPQPNGAACAADAECLSGYCDPTTALCADRPVTPGDPSAMPGPPGGMMPMGGEGEGGGCTVAARPVPTTSLLPLLLLAAAVLLARRRR